MEKVKKSAKKWLCISIALMLLSAIVVSFIQTDGGKAVSYTHLDVYKRQTRCWPSTGSS